MNTEKTGKITVVCFLNEGSLGVNENEEYFGIDVSSGWEPDKLADYKTDFITDYSEKGCPNNSSVRPTKAIVNWTDSRRLRVQFKISCGGGFLLRGNCIEAN